LFPGWRVVRAVPNTPCLVRAGLTGLAWGEGVSSAQQTWVQQLFSQVGEVLVLPEAQLDRFFLKLRMDFPGVEDIHTILDRTTYLEEAAVERVWDAEKIMELRDIALAVPISQAVQDYALRIIMSTQPSTAHAHAQTKKYLRYGASPRGGQALIVGGKVRALLKGHNEVQCDDIRDVVLPALRHRVILNFEGEAERVDPDSILKAILESVPEK